MLRPRGGSSATARLTARGTERGARERAFWCDQVVAEPLMVPFSVVVHHELVEHVPEAPFPEENEAVPSEGPGFFGPR